MSENRTHVGQNQVEEQCAREAYKFVQFYGGFVTFDEYDAKMAHHRRQSEPWQMFLFPPWSWRAGAENSHWADLNVEKLAAFAACHAGLLLQENGGYRCVD